MLQRWTTASVPKDTVIDTNEAVLSLLGRIPLDWEPSPLSDLGCHPSPLSLPSNNLGCHPLSLNDFQCHPSFLPHPTPHPLITLDAIHYPKWLWMPYIFAINHTSLTYFLYHPPLPHFPLYAFGHHPSLPSPHLPPKRLWVPTTEQYLNVTVHITFGLLGYTVFFQ